METKWKKAETTIDVKPIKDACILKGTGKQSIIGLSNSQFDDKAEFNWQLVAIGENAFMEDCPINIGDNVIVKHPPVSRIELPTNHSSYKSLCQKYNELGSTNREELQRLVREVTKIEVVEYFFIDSYDIIGIKLGTDSDFVEEVIDKVSPTV
jgi:hypothetical protein